VQHQLLNATQDLQEAQQVARAGQAGCVTVATNMAGRGTDIRLDEAATAAGGLHVIATMCNRARRIDRQLLGRAARHGDPGSAEQLLSLDDHLLQTTCPAALLRVLRLRACRPTLHPWLTQLLFGGAQRLAEWRDRSHRRELHHADEAAAETYAFSGGLE
jgi:preprotein translocase subunit SecA